MADELLELIFLEVVSAGYITTATMAAMQLAGVCSRWRIVALNRGRLWSRLSTFDPVLFRMSLSRSLSASLSLKFDVCDTQTITLALTEIHRVVDLDVAVFPVLAVVAAGEKTAPVLRTVSLQYDHTCRSPLLEGWSMPMLEKLSLANTSLRSTGHLLLETLTTLELMNVDCCDATGASGRSLCFQSFGRLRALQSLRLIRCLSRTFSRSSMGSVRVRLPALETLSVMDLPGPILPFLQHIDIPANASLSLSFDSCLPRNGLARNMADWFCHSFFRRAGNGGLRAAVHTASFEVLARRFQLVLRNHRNADASTPPKPAVEMTFDRREKLSDAVAFGSCLPLGDMACLRLVQQIGVVTPSSWNWLRGVSTKVETLVLGQAAYDSAAVCLGENPLMGLPAFPALKTLVLQDIRHAHHGTRPFRALIDYLEDRVKLHHALQSVVLRGCTIFSWNDVEKLKMHVASVDHDGDTTLTG